MLDAAGTLLVEQTPSAGQDAAPEIDQAQLRRMTTVSRQAVRLGYLPHLTVRHTSTVESGQIYVPAVNWLLFGGVLVLMFVFRSSNKLATAYGLARGRSARRGRGRACPCRSNEAGDTRAGRTSRITRSPGPDPVAPAVGARRRNKRHA